MKYICLILISFSAVLIIACNKDCNPASLDENIIGNWSVISVYNGININGGDVEFYNDHTGHSPGSFFQRVDSTEKIKDFTWQTSGDSLLMVKHTGKNNYTDLKVYNLECDKMQLKLISDVYLTRK